MGPIQCLERCILWCGFRSTEKAVALARNTTNTEAGKYPRCMYYELSVFLKVLAFPILPTLLFNPSAPEKRQG